MTQHKPSKYAASGVDIDAGGRVVELIGDAVESTHRSKVLAGVGAFGGVYDPSAIMGLKEPVLVASTDGVGTKVMLGVETGRLGAIGHDIVNHCVNDVLVQGAQPLFFLDYVACSQLEPEKAAQIVLGMAEACREAECVLLGGETAEMPGVYGEGQFDVVGTLVGVVERARILPSKDIKPGDLLLGLASSGPHTNGYSLIRRVFADTPLEDTPAELDRPLVDLLLAPHRCYLPILAPLLSRAFSPIKGLVHITGGGFFDNIPRILPDGCGARLDHNSWQVPALYGLIQRHADVSDKEMYRVFNMGIGMVVIIEAHDLAQTQEAIQEPSWVIGEVINRSGVEFVK